MVVTTTRLSLRRALLTLVPLLLVGALHAAEEDPGIRTDLLSVCVNGEVENYHYLNNGKAAVLDASMAGMGSPITYRGSRRLAFFKHAADLKPAPDGPQRKAICEVLLPQENRVLLIFTFAGENNTKPAVRAVGVSTDGMKPGDYRVFNFSRQDVGVIFGERKVGLASGKDTTLTTPEWRSAVSDIGVQIAISRDKTVRRVYSSMWGHRPERRMFVFLFDSSDPNRPIEVRKTYDVPSVAAISVNPSEEKPAPTE
jgi:hypothetical protein